MMDQLVFITHLNIYFYRQELGQNSQYNDKAMGLTARKLWFNFWRGQDFFSSPKHQDELWSLPILPHNG